MSSNGYLPTCEARRTNPKGAKGLLGNFAASSAMGRPNHTDHAIDQLFLIFNADSGKWSAFLDSARKIFMLEGCSLCSITHGVAGEKAEWSDCKASLSVPVEYVHRDELSGELAEVAGSNLPCVVARAGGEYITLLTPRTLAECNGQVSALTEKIRRRAADLGLSFPE